MLKYYQIERMIKKMKSVEIKKDIYWVGALDADLRVFDIIMYTPYGTTYNSYVVKGSEKTAVFETVKEQFFDEYIERLKSLDIDITNIDYIVVDHTEPDHAGSVAKLLDLSPNATVIGSRAAIEFMKNIANKPFHSKVVNDGDKISLGNKTLKFISAPFLHWPDSMYTYVPEDSTLITCDSFGSHYCEDNIFNDLVKSEENYMDALKYYYDCIFGPFKPYILKAIDKIKDLSIDLICPGHGPVLRHDPWKIVNIYKEWSTPKEKSEKPSVAISYVSAYGYTKQLAEEISKGIRSKGDFNINLFDLVYAKEDEVLQSINEADGILFGSPTINGDLLEPVRALLTKLNPIVHGGKIAGAFGSYGWSGEAVPNMERRLKELRMDLTLPSLRINFKPSSEDLTQAFKFGEGVAEKIIGKKSKISNGKKVSTRYWKCLICGEIFEGDTAPEICPVCGASKEQFVEVKMEATDFISHKEETFVIIGNGAAGFYSASSIRKRNSKARILMLSKENSISYYRPALSDYISEIVPDNEFFIAPEEWYKENNIEQLLGVEVISIDKDKKIITFKDNSTLLYDKLIFATGASNFLPPTKISGSSSNCCGEKSLTYDNYKNIHGVFLLRTLDDAKDIRTFIEAGHKKAVIVGGGLLGLEAAWELKNQGLEVSVVEFAQRLLPRQLDNEGAELFKSLADKSGIKLILGAAASEIVLSSCCDHKSKVTKVLLNNGDVIDSDMVLFSVGIRPNKTLAESIGISCDKGIIVNTHMETNIKDIYACGDVAELNGLVYGNWPAAIEMGKVSGANAVGDNCEFQDFVSSTIFKALDTEIFSAGTINFDDNKLKQVSAISFSEGLYKKLFFKDNNLVGGILIGDTSKSGKIITGIQKSLSLEDTLKEDIL